MASHPNITPQPQEELFTEVSQQKPQPARPERAVAPFKSPVRIVALRTRNWLSETLLEMSPTRPQRRTMDLFLSIIIHTSILAAVLLPPLYFTKTIDLKRFGQTLLVAPPPPPPPPPMAQTVTKAVPTRRRLFTSGGKLVAPTSIPKKIAILKEEPLPPEISPGVVGGVPGGVPGGQLGGVIGGIISGSSRMYVPVPSSPQPKAPLRVGGRIKPPRALLQPTPNYPILAKAIKLQGAVQIDAVIDAEGNVIEMRAISGPALLIPAALEAVRKWKYEPTYLNDQPIAVQLVVTVTFRLEQ